MLTPQDMASFMMGKNIRQYGHLDTLNSCYNRERLIHKTCYYRVWEFNDYLGITVPTTFFCGNIYTCSRLASFPHIELKFGRPTWQLLPERSEKINFIYFSIRSSPYSWKTVRERYA